MSDFAQNVVLTYLWITFKQLDRTVEMLSSCVYSVLISKGSDSSKICDSSPKI